MIVAGHLIEKSGGQSSLIPEFHAHMGQIPSDDIAHGLGVRTRDLPYSLDEIRDMYHLSRIDLARHTLVEGANQDRHDAKFSCWTQNVLEEEDLKLDRVLRTMRQLIRQEVGGIAPRQGAHQCLVGLYDPERRLIVLQGEREGHGSRLVGGTKNHEHVGRHLTYSLVGPGEA